ncbi:MAG: hypothetical protein BM557_00895 [Flavobacterium sp. MedPE-SWcel]|nr:MAG: hypothetical protein BM557_00895 [Flavobacterium sp. MedPE-SWcel]
MYVVCSFLMIIYPFWIDEIILNYVQNGNEKPVCGLYILGFIGAYWIIGVPIVLVAQYFFNRLKLKPIN